ncbi:hypothetical protein QKW60_10960 [Defluviimonas aestuarii]|nr:hypothetical protein [Defluviimonas aestuarii]MDI3336931.1 hypothetical protein [Defluviimonas aestuarii]
MRVATHFTNKLASIPSKPSVDISTPVSKKYAAPPDGFAANAESTPAC